MRKGKCKHANSMTAFDKLPLEVRTYMNYMIDPPSPESVLELLNSHGVNIILTGLMEMQSQDQVTGFR